MLTMQPPVARPAPFIIGRVVTLNYAIDDELHQRLKVIAALQATTLKAVVIEALAEYADRHDTAGKNPKR